jgi:hypothetical protein
VRQCRGLSPIQRRRRMHDPLSGPQLDERFGQLTIYKMISSTDSG